ncbi:hypothetical protein NL676_000916 [Syzygium grande]|nr:hypothetical protein NL676_000916 [Syzygium grande]
MHKNASSDDPFAPTASVSSNNVGIFRAGLACAFACANPNATEAFGWSKSVSLNSDFAGSTASFFSSGSSSCCSFACSREWGKWAYDTLRYDAVGCATGPSLVAWNFGWSFPNVSNSEEAIVRQRWNDKDTVPTMLCCPEFMKIFTCVIGAEVQFG